MPTSFVFDHTVPDSQRVPENPAGHWQKKLLPFTWHLPPLRQGDGEQGVVGIVPPENRTITGLIQKLS